MEFIIDTVNLEEIKEAVEYLPIVGVTSNPSIVKKTNPQNFFKHMKEIRKIIGQERSLHIQVISKDCDTIIKEAHRILKEVDDKVYIKVPVSYEGIKAIKLLKEEGINVTATAVYDLMQAYMALEAKADYIAPYVNRIGNLGADPFELINELSNRIIMDGYESKIVAASFKGVQQVKDALNNGAQAVTVPVEVLKQIFANPNIEKAVKEADLVIGSVLIPGKAAPKIFKKKYLKEMKPGAVFVDVAVDQGGCGETTKVTYHDDPIFIEDGVVHYCVGNMPGAVPRTSTIALTNATVSYGLQIANKGLEQACKDNEVIYSAINTYDGKLTCKNVADSFDCYEYVDIKTIC